jgi:ribosome maturation factor RimP
LNRSTLEGKLIKLIEPLVNELGVELVDLEYRSARKGHLCIYIDKPGGVGIKDCEAVSRDVSELLDIRDPIPGSYVLEVSSPGVERTLRKKEDFQRFLGEAARLYTIEPVNGRKKFTGTLVQAQPGHVALLLEDGERVELPFTEIKKAHLVYRPVKNNQ